MNLLGKMKYSFVTYLGTDSFLPGVLALNESLKKYNKSIFLLVLITENISTDVVVRLQLNHCSIKIIDCIQNPLKFENDQKGYKYLYTKLRLFDLIEFNKIVYIDADIIICQNIEALFERPHMSAVAAGKLVNPNWQKLNSGLTVIEPDRGLFEEMFASIGKLYSNGGDQGFLNSFYNSWPLNSSLHLEHKYNVPFVYLQEYCDLGDFTFSYTRKKIKTNIAALHYWGVTKHWQINIELFSRREKSKNVQALFLWWDMYSEANLKNQPDN